MLLWLRHPRNAPFRVPLMGVVQKPEHPTGQSAGVYDDRIYSPGCVENHGTNASEIGWILEDNQGMVAIAEAINSNVNREYRIYSRLL